MDRIDINKELVQNLISRQFPEYDGLPIGPVEEQGHDNRTFRLGEELTVRLPSAKAYSDHVYLEWEHLPRLQKMLNFPISAPIALGQPDDCFPFPWTVGRWIPGQTVTHENVRDETRLAKELSDWLRQLQAADPSNTPLAGAHNFYRGGELSVYHRETLEALERLKTVLPPEDIGRYRMIWEDALSTRYAGSPVWVHGDVAVGNLLVRDGRLAALIDFGTFAAGDPACDYVMAWTFFDRFARQVFLEGLPEDMILRAKGWALWKALITYHDENPKPRALSKTALGAVLEE